MMRPFFLMLLNQINDDEQQKIIQDIGDFMVAIENDDCLVVMRVLKDYKVSEKFREFVDAT